MFYESLADGLPIDAAVSEARKAISVGLANSLEWGTPVLHLRAADGVLFAVGEGIQRKVAEEQRGRGGGKETGDKAIGNRGARGEEDKEKVQPEPVDQRTVEPTPPAARTPATPSDKPVTPPVVIVRPPIEFDWVTIPAGEFGMGSDKQKDRDDQDNELPQHRLFLPEYRIARGPVTVAQFAQFVAATNYKTTAEVQGSAWGWNGKQWANIEGVNWAHPRGPKSDVEQKENHLVTAVSWHDAVAFCAWATAEYAKAGQNLNIRLPTEAEWEKAARGTDVRLYPWGNEAPDAKRCNFDMNIKDTTPVGQYPKGVYDLVDMAGNVWEWTNSKYKGYPYAAEDGREDAAGGDGRVLRGGAFISNRNKVRCAARDFNDPVYRSYNLGFRVVAPVSGVLASGQ